MTELPATPSTVVPTSVLDAAIEQVRATNPTLAATLLREVDALRDGRKFGLVFNRHLPESVRLPNHPVKRGVKVALRNPQALGTGKAARAAKDATWRVTKTEKAAGPEGTAERVAWLDGVDAPRLIDDLVVIREFGEPVYPGLKSVGRIDRGKPGDPTHLVINGENHHALQALQFTHRGKIDLIYIDPPYNTGNQGWIYNDKYVDVTRGDASSKWLSFMERRLLIARELLKDTGVIIVAIGDDEHHRLRMLLDQIFGTQNFISNVVWQGGRKNDSRYISNGADYMLVYARDEASMATRETRWREEKEGVEAVLHAGSVTWALALSEVMHEIHEEREDLRGLPGNAWLSYARTTDHAKFQILEGGIEAHRSAVADIVERLGLDAQEFYSRVMTAATVRMRDWFKKQPKDSPVQLLSRNVWFLPDGTLCRDADTRSPNPRPNLQYDLPHPITGSPCRRHPNGWVYSRETMQRLIEEGRIIFRESHEDVVSLKRPLADTSGNVVMSVFEKNRTHSGRHLEAVLGDKRFPFPKDHEVLMRWLRLTAPKDAVILDFFGGSGTTAEAVLRLNAEDGGTRQSILVTNNELSAADAKRLTKDGLVPGDPEWEARGVFEYVTRPRTSTVVTGERPDGSVYSDGLDANVEFFHLTYLDESRVSRAQEFKGIAPLLWMQVGATGERIDAESGDGYVINDNYAVLHDDDAAGRFLKAIAEQALASEPPSHVYVVTDSPSHFEHVSGRLPAGVAAHQLYGSYLRNFEINVEAR